MWYTRVVYEILYFWRPQDFDFFHKLTHNHKVHPHKRQSTHARELQQELRQCDARAHGAPATHCATVLSRDNAKIAAQSKLVGPRTMISAHGSEPSNMPSKALSAEGTPGLLSRVGAGMGAHDHDPTTERMSACMTNTRQAKHKHHAGAAQIWSPRASISSV